MYQNSLHKIELNGGHWTLNQIHVVYELPQRYEVHKHTLITPELRTAKYQSTPGSHFAFRKCYFG